MKTMIVLCGLSLMFATSGFSQKNDTVPVQKKTVQPPDTAFKNPIYKGPAEIDSLNRTDSLRGGKRVTPIDRYREDTIPKRKEK